MHSALYFNSESIPNFIHNTFHEVVLSYQELSDNPHYSLHLLRLLRLRLNFSFMYIFGEEHILNHDRSITFENFFNKRIV